MIRYERMSADFEKWHLGDGKAIHRFNGVDKGGPHDHPADFTSTVLIGGYVERFYWFDAKAVWHSDTVTRLPGDTFDIKAEHIHEIIELLDGPAMTHVEFQPHRRETLFWRFNQDGARSRPWHQPDFG